MPVNSRCPTVALRQTGRVAKFERRLLFHPVNADLQLIEVMLPLPSIVDTRQSLSIHQSTREFCVEIVDVREDLGEDFVG